MQLEKSVMCLLSIKYTFLLFPFLAVIIQSSATHLLPVKLNYKITTLLAQVNAFKN